MMSIDICCCWCWKERKNLWCYHFIENGNRNGVYILSMSCVCCKCGIHGIFNQMWHTWNAYAASTYIDFFIIMWNSKIFRSVNKAEAAAPNNISSFIPHPQHTIKSTTHSAHTHTLARKTFTHTVRISTYSELLVIFFSLLNTCTETFVRKTECCTCVRTNVRLCACLRAFDHRTDDTVFACLCESLSSLFGCAVRRHLTHTHTINMKASIAQSKQRTLIPF